MTLRLFLAQPTIIFAARVHQGSFAYPIAQVTFDGVTTGAYGDIVPGMTVLFGSSAGGDEYGRQRVRKAATSSILYFGRSSRGTRDGEVDLVDNAHITVLNDYRVWSKIPYIDDDAIVYKDNDLPVGTYTTDPPPVANAGVPMAGTIDSGTDLLRVTLPGTGAKASFAVSGTISSYAWTLPSGVALVGGYALSDAQIEVDCDPGFYWIALTVTDSNAETHTMHLPISARDPDADTSIASFSVEAHRKTTDGQRLAVRILEDIPEATYPDGTLVLLWEDEPSTGADRSHMVFWGWHQTDPTTIAAERTGILRDVMFDCLDVAGKLDTLPGFTLSLEVAASPATWAQMTVPNMDKYLHYLLHWHTTALEVADWSWSGTTTAYPFVVLGNSGESLWDQLARRAKALVPDYILGCNTHGQLQTIVDPMLQDAGSRAATVQATLEEADWSSIRYTHQRPPRAHWLRGEAILASNTTLAAIFCIAPGESPGQGETPFSQGEQLAASQAALNACEGHRYGRHNAPQGYFSILLAEGDDQSIEPADMTWVRLNVSADTAAQRGLTFSNERGLVREMNVRYDHARTGLIKSVELLWERETSGTPAVTVLLPAGGLPDPEWEPPDVSYDPTPETPSVGEPPQQPSARALSGLGDWYASRGHWYLNGYFSPATSPTGSPHIEQWASVTSPPIEKTSLMWSASTNRLYGYGYLPTISYEDAIWEYTPLPLDEGEWVSKRTALQIATLFGREEDYDHVYLFRMQFSIKSSQEGWGWVGGRLEYTTGEVEHVILFCLHTRDGWDTVKYATEICDLTEGVDYYDGVPPSFPNALAVDMHADKVYILWCLQPYSEDHIDPTRDGWWKLYRSQDFGYSFALAQSETYVWGVDGYFDNASELAHCDIWIPWKSDIYTGGTLFWSVAMMTVEQNDPDLYVTQVYQSQNHALSYKDIGDDGGLTGAITFLGGPYNAIDRVYAGVSTVDQGGAESPSNLAIYTWRDGFGWTEFRDSDPLYGSSARQNWVVLEQTGYALYSGMAYRDPLYMQSIAEWDQDTPEQVTWVTYVPESS